MEIVANNRSAIALKLAPKMNPRVIHKGGIQWSGIGGEEENFIAILGGDESEQVEGKRVFREFDVPRGSGEEVVEEERGGGGNRETEEAAGGGEERGAGAGAG